MKSTVKNLLIRADANLEIGVGHVMRCLALAQAWQDSGGIATFAMVRDSKAVESRLAEEKISILQIGSKPGSMEDATELVDVARDIGVEWIVIDGYHFGVEYQHSVKKTGFSPLFIDDYGHCKHYHADIVLNQNIGADEKLYKNREPYTRLLLGTKYALLRREFLKYREWERQIPELARKILVTMGGGDPGNVTFKVITALKQIEEADLEVVAVVGNANPHYDSLAHAVGDSRHGIRLERSAEDMSALMAWADFVIAGGGSTCWELAYMGLPAILIVMADNQRGIAEGLENRGFAINLGWHENVRLEDIAAAVSNMAADAGSRRRMSAVGWEIVDSLGAGRVVESLTGTIREETD